MREQRLHAMPGIALPHEAEAVEPSCANSGVCSGTRSLPARVRDDRSDATRWLCKSLPGLLSRREQLA